VKHPQSFEGKYIGKSKTIDYKGQRQFKMKKISGLPTFYGKKKAKKSTWRQV
jgi:hypothetical protein